jgi:hypothetical protein
MVTAPKRKPQPLKRTSRASKRKSPSGPSLSIPPETNLCSTGTKPTAAKPSATDANTRELHRASLTSFPLEALRQLLSHNISFGRPHDLLSLEHAVYDEYLRTPAAFKPRERFPAEAIGAAIAASLETKKSLPQEQMQKEVQEQQSADETPIDELMPLPELKHYSQLLLDIFTKSPEAPEGPQTEQTEAEQDLVSRCCSGQQRSPTPAPAPVLFPAPGPGPIPGLELISTNQSYQPQLEFIQKDQDGYGIPPSIEISTST